MHDPAMRNPPPGYPRVSPYLLYEDAPRVIDYLKHTFGFEERLSQMGVRDACTLSSCSAQTAWS
jgi:hypothetical protein